MIHLKTLNKNKLENFVLSGASQNFDFIPITKHRAQSQMKNPKADEEQTLLILAYEGEKLTGYVGCLPDSFLIDGKKFNYAWLSTLFVSSDFRGKRIAQKLLDKAFEEYNGNIAITEFTKEAENLYKKIGLFHYIKPKQGKKFYFKTDLETILPLKNKKTKPLQPFLKIADSVANIIISVKNSYIKQPDFRYEILHRIDSESADFITKFKSNRTAEEINWAIENPWILEGEAADKRYLFSSYSLSFKYFWVKVYCDNNLLTTCSLLMVRNGHLKIPYLFSDSDLRDFIDYLSYFIIKNKVKKMTSYQADLNEKISESLSFPDIHLRKTERRYMFHQNLLNHLPENFEPDFQDGDGDCLMT